MKLCLVNPPHPYLKQPTSQAPLGLMYVASAVRARNIPVEFLDLSDRHYDDEYEIPEADIYGLTGTVLDRKPCMSVAKRVKKLYPKSKVIIGGPITLTPEYIQCEDIDSIVKGEGEFIIFDIMRDFPNLKPLYIAERIRDLDSLDFPARDMVSNLGGNIFAYNKNYKGNGSTVIISSRGCPNNCAFCASPGIWKRRTRFRSIENVVAEVDEIINKYGIYQLRFSDDNLTLRRDHVTGICKALGPRGVIWRSSIRTKPNDLELFRVMYEGGCREVSFGVESADPDVLKFLQKGATVDDNRRAIENAKEAGMVVRILFMIGTPGESEKTVERNVAFLESVPYDTIALTQFIPIPGSAIAETPEKFDCEILDRDIDHYNFYMWGPEGKNEWRDLIKLRNLPLEVTRSNRNRMREYVINCGKSNLG